MNTGIKLRFIILIMLLALLITSCNPVTTSDSDSGLEDSLDKIEEVELIPGAGNVTLIVNDSDETYFTLEFQNIGENDLIQNGIMEGWCIDWATPISANNGTYHGIKLYSTFGVEKWNGLNALLNMKDQMFNEDSSITYREIQAAIWALRPYPAFDLDNIDTDALPGDMIQNGELHFDLPKVRAIVKAAELKGKSLIYDGKTKFAIIAETPADVQTVITII